MNPAVWRLARVHYSHLTAASTASAGRGHRRLAATMPPVTAVEDDPTAPATPAPPPLRGVVFDMDGTLTVPNLDFAEMYRRAGVPSGDDILSAKWQADGHASAIVEEMEAEGRRTLQLMVGAGELAMWLGAHGIPIGLVTRNSSRTVDHFHASCWPATVPPMDPAISRDDPFPPKPDPGALAAIQASWGVADGSSLLMCDRTEPSRMLVRS